MNLRLADFRSSPVATRFAYSAMTALLLVTHGAIAEETTSQTRESRARQVAAIEKSISAGTRFLIEQQQPDGTWQSKTYGLLKDGTSLTPLVLWSLPKSPTTEGARNQGLTAMSSWVGTSDRPGRVRVLPQYPVYSAGLATRVLNRSGSADRKEESLAWRDLLIAYQLTDANDWPRDDVRFGGWSYSHESPSKPDDLAKLSPLDEPNLSATVCALDGLAAAPLDGEPGKVVQANALLFVQRCQNWRENAAAADTKFNDGGFHFMLGDDVRNKPGVAGTDSTGEKRFASYGSTTADGLRALLLCGLKPDHPRVVAAHRWLMTNFQDGAHPGAYPANRAQLQPSLDYYYAASVANAFRRVHADAPTLSNGRWATLLANRLLARQKSDGSWSNPAVDVREDDPLIATPFALSALRACADELK